MALCVFALATIALWYNFVRPAFRTNADGAYINERGTAGVGAGSYYWLTNDTLLSILPGVSTVKLDSFWYSNKKLYISNANHFGILYLKSGNFCDSNGIVELYGIGKIHSFLSSNLSFLMQHK